MISNFKTKNCFKKCLKNLEIREKSPKIRKCFLLFSLIFLWILLNFNWINRIIFCQNSFRIIEKLFWKLPKNHKNMKRCLRNFLWIFNDFIILSWILIELIQSKNLYKFEKNSKNHRKITKNSQKLKIIIPQHFMNFPQFSHFFLQFLLNFNWISYENGGKILKTIRFRPTGAAVHFLPEGQSDPRRLVRQPHRRSGPERAAHLADVRRPSASGILHRRKSVPLRLQHGVGAAHQHARSPAPASARHGPRVHLLPAVAQSPKVLRAPGGGQRN